MIEYIRLEPPEGPVPLTEWLAGALPGMNVREAAKLTAAGAVRVNGRCAARRTLLSGGEAVELVRRSAFHGPLDIAYEDRNLIAVNKPADVDVTAGGEGQPSLLELVAARMRERNEYIESVGDMPYACYTLDPQTGGLVLFAKNGELYSELRLAMRQRRIVRYVRCQVAGDPGPKGEIRGYMPAEEGKARLYAKPARGLCLTDTRFHRLSQADGLSLVEAQPITDAPGQLLVHMAGLKTPVLGDERYGDKKANKLYGVHIPAVWTVRIEFYTGPNNILSYLDGVTISARRTGLPYAAFAD